MKSTPYKPPHVRAQPSRMPQIIRDLNLRKPQFKQVASYGHFGRNDLDVAWERTDKADLLRKEAGLAEGVK